MAPQTLVPSENWDDDFEFSQTNSNIKKSNPTKSLPEPRLSLASSRLIEDWDADNGSRQPSPKAPPAGSSRARGMGGISSRLDDWAEPGPSTPTKSGSPQAQTENWDDDFEDKGDSPPGRRQNALRASVHAFQLNNHAHPLRTRHSYHTPPRPKPRAEPENWDDDFDDPMDPTSSMSPNKTDNDNTPITKRTRREAYADSSDEDEDFGLSDDKEEDKTLTARSRTAPMLRPGSANTPLSANSPLPPVPPLPRALSSSPIEPFPRSPTVSVFSIPTTSGRNSIGHFNSTSHLVLSGASSLAMHPPSPPALRERRRLRKKSRPPHMDNNVFELIEEPYDSSPPPLPPSTPDRMRATSPLPTALSSPLEATPGSGGSKTPLLSRIGSVKKWNVRRKRASTGPAEVIMQDFSALGGGTMDVDGTSRPPSSLDQTQPQTPSNRNRNSNNTGGMRSGWFFRPGGAHSGAGSPPPRQAELKHERSLDQARLRPEAGDGGSEGGTGRVPTTPSKSNRFSRRKASGVLEYTSSGDLTGGDGSSSASGVIGLGKPSLGPGRRPSSMQVPNGASLLGSGKFGSIGTRHTSYGSSVGRASSSRMFSTPTPTESAEYLPPVPALPPQQDGSRSFMGSVRKISLVGGKKHKKRKSSIELAQIHAASLQDDVGDDAGREQDVDADTRMQTPPKAGTPDLLPPIELHPPSPPRTIDGMSTANSIPLHLRDGHEPVMPSTSAPSSVTMTPIGPSMSPGTPMKTTLKSPSSPPQSASLGRTTQVPSPPTLSTSVPRRNSLGDLKIPPRISQAQIGLKRDLGMVREFASSVDRLKELQSTYQRLLTEAQMFLENTPASRATSPNVFNLVRPRSRLRSNTSPSNHASSSAPTPAPEHSQIAASLHAITNKYKVPWECAELLIELGGGTPVPASPPPSGASSSLSAPVQAELDRRKNRERAVTLSGEESKPSSTAITSNAAATSSSTSGPSDPSWRSSTGRHDLSQRQLILLRDMLSSGELPADDSLLTEENVNRNWRWGDGMNSTVTLPSEDSDSRGVELDVEGAKKKRRGPRLGLMGLRDMLRMLKRSHSEHVASPPAPALPAASTVSLSTDSSHYSHHYPHGQVGTRGGGPRLRPQTSGGLESVRSTKDKDAPANSPYGGGQPLNHKSSPRRPSLASIFRLGQKSNKSTSFSSQDSRSDVRSDSRGSTRTEEDWDRIESAIDLDGAARALGIEGSATVKGRNKGRASSPFLSEPLPHPHPHAPTPVPVPAPILTQLTHRPVTPRRAEMSQVVRLEVEASPRSIRPMRSTRLSNVQEVSDGEQRGGVRSSSGGSSKDSGKAKNRVSLPRTNPLTQRPPSRGGSNVPAGASGRTGSVRSAPPTQPLEDGGPPHPHPLVPHLHPHSHAHLQPEMKLSMTPENIKPLLESAREVHVRCRECIRELHVLLDVTTGPGPGTS